MQWKAKKSHLWLKQWFKGDSGLYLILLFEKGNKMVFTNHFWNLGVCFNSMFVVSDLITVAPVWAKFKFLFSNFTVSSPHIPINMNHEFSIKFIISTTTTISTESYRVTDVWNYQKNLLHFNLFCRKIAKYIPDNTLPSSVIRKLFFFKFSLINWKQIREISS